MDNRAIQIVRDYYRKDLGLESNSGIPMDDLDVYIVWKCKTLQNWKYMLSTNIPDTRYFEVTYNGDKEEFYLDSYVKENNQCIKL